MSSAAAAGGGVGGAGATGMTADQAVRLVNAWEGATVSGRPAALAITANGDFTHQARGAFFQFEGAGRRLVVSGLVGQEMLQFSVAKEPWDELQQAASREQATLGEGRFVLIDKPVFKLVPPVLLLSKAFTDGGMANAQFLLEVRWLLEWATHWRTRRMGELNSASSPDHIARQGAAHVDFALRQRPRPW